MHKHADLIMNFAKMVAAGHPIHYLVQQKVSHHKDGWGEVVSDWKWAESHAYRVAIAFVEGRPVFEGDVLYESKGERFPVNAAWSDCILVSHGGNCRRIENLSWTTSQPVVGAVYSMGEKVADITSFTISPSGKPIAPPPDIFLDKLKIEVDASAINEATLAMNKLTIAADEARMAMDRLRK